jgi:hypothetical protein
MGVVGARPGYVQREFRKTSGSVDRGSITQAVSATPICRSSARWPPSEGITSSLTIAPALGGRSSCKSPCNLVVPAGMGLTTSSWPSPSGCRARPTTACPSPWSSPAPLCLPAAAWELIYAASVERLRRGQRDGIEHGRGQRHARARRIDRRKVPSSSKVGGGGVVV